MIDTKYQTLPEKFTGVAHGYDFSLIKRQGDIALYEARWINGSELQGYVVAKIFRRPARSYPNGIAEPAKEYFPSPSQFGPRARFFLRTSKHIAERRFSDLVRMSSHSNETDNGPSRMMEVSQ